MSAVAFIDERRDGARMVSKRKNRMYALSEDERCRIVELVIDEFGGCLGFDEFAAVIHGLFEDIPGIETMGADEANHLINLMWSQYHG